MATRKLSVNIPSKFLDFIDIYQTRHKDEIMDTCDHVCTRDTTIEYIFLMIMPLIDYALYKETFGNELSYPKYDMGKLLMTLIQAFGIKDIDVKGLDGPEIRIIHGKPQHVLTINNKVIYIIGNHISYKKYRQEVLEIKECIPKVLAGDSSQLVNYMMSRDDQKLITESSEISGDTKLIDVESVEIKREDQKDVLKDVPQKSTAECIDDRSKADIYIPVLQDLEERLRKMKIDK